MPNISSSSPVLGPEEALPWAREVGLVTDALVECLALRRRTITLLPMLDILERRMCLRDAARLPHDWPRRQLNVGV